MIKVIYLNEKDCIYLKVEGHSNSAPKGEDLVCAAVSSITIGGLNALENEYEVVMKDGLIEVKGKTSSKDKIVFETIFIQLKTIEEKYPNYLVIERKENDEI